MNVMSKQDDMKAEIVGAGTYLASWMVLTLFLTAYVKAQGIIVNGAIDQTRLEHGTLGGALLHLGDLWEIYLPAGVLVLGALLVGVLALTPLTTNNARFFAQGLRLIDDVIAVIYNILCYYIATFLLFNLLTPILVL